MIGQKDLKMVVSNIGVVPDFSSLYTTNAGPYTATIQVALNEPHQLSSFDYMDRVKRQMANQYPDVRTFFSQRIDGRCNPEHGVCPPPSTFR